MQFRKWPRPTSTIIRLVASARSYQLEILSCSNLISFALTVVVGVGIQIEYFKKHTYGLFKRKNFSNIFHYYNVVIYIGTHIYKAKQNETKNVRLSTCFSTLFLSIFTSHECPCIKIFLLKKKIFYFGAHTHKNPMLQPNNIRTEKRRRKVLKARRKWKLNLKKEKISI